MTGDERADAWDDLHTSSGATREEVDAIRAGILAMAGSAEAPDVITGLDQTVI